MEVDPLDSLFGIDETRVPGAGDELREPSAELGLAWAAASDWEPAVNVLRGQRARAAGVTRTRVAAVAGLAAGLDVIAWAIVRNPQPRPASAPVARMAPVTEPAVRRQAAERVMAHVSTPPASSRFDRGRSVTLPQAVSTAGPAIGGAPAIAAAPQSGPIVGHGLQPVPPAVSPQTPPPRPTAAPWPPLLPLTSISIEQRRAPPKPVVPPPVAAAPAPPRTVVTPRAEVRPPVVEKPPVAVEQPAAAPPGRARTVRQQPSTPFDASLETILYSPGRRLEMIDGRIVQVGDVVRDATIIDITPAAVLLRDSAGRRRLLTLEGRRCDAGYG